MIVIWQLDQDASESAYAYRFLHFRQQQTRTKDILTIQTVIFESADKNLTNVTILLLHKSFI